MPSFCRITPANRTILFQISNSSSKPKYSPIFRFIPQAILTINTIPNQIRSSSFQEKTFHANNNQMDAQVVFALNFKGECKLINLSGRVSFMSLLNQVRDKWVELDGSSFSFTCSVGGFINCLLESDNDLSNLLIICTESSSKIVKAELRNIAPIIPAVMSSIPCSHPVSDPNPICSVSTLSGEIAEFSGVLNIPSYDVSPPIAKTAFLSDHWVELMNGGVGSIFIGGCDHFRSSIRKYSAKMEFRFLFLKNTDRYIHVVCSESIIGGCEWHIRAKKLKVSGYFIIYKAHLTHSCIGKVMKDKTKRLGAKILGDLMIADVKSNSDISANDLALTIRTKYGFEIPYSKAWRAIEFAKDQIYGSFDDSYDQLRWYCKAVERTNPGSVVCLDTNCVSHRFERVFFAFKACLDGFKSCRPMIFIDGTFLKGRAQGTLLVATAKDGNNGLFPVAFALVSAENTSNWEWFIRKIDDHVKHEKEMYFISDRNCGLLSALNNVFEKPRHFYCLFHLLTNLRGRFSSGWTNSQRADLQEIFKACAYAPEERLFNEKIELFKLVGGKKAVEWLSQLPFEKWSIAHSPHITRYGEMTSNAVESFNSWILEARSLPIVKMIDWIRQNIARWYVERREVSNKWSTPLVLRKQVDWNVMYDTGRAWRVTLSPGGEFEVKSDMSCIVDLREKSCSCHQWKVTGFPCAHAIAVIMRQNGAIYTYVEECFHTSKYRQSYEANINPIPATMQFECETICDQQKIFPPLLNRKPGRPKKMRIPSFGEFPKKKSPLCGHCGKRGYHDPSCIKGPGFTSA